MVLSLRIFLLCYYCVRNILMLLGYFNTTLKELKVIYPDRTSDPITINELHDVPINFSLSNFLKEI